MLKVMTLAVALICATGGTPAQAADLNEGDVAPGFSLPGSDGNTYGLASFKGKQVVVLAWYPKAFTGG